MIFIDVTGRSTASSRAAQLIFVIRSAGNGDTTTLCRVFEANVDNEIKFVMREFALKFQATEFNVRR